MADSILIVEDDPVIRTFLADNLTADGYDLLVAGTIEEALRELESRRPDLAVVDLRLPDGSGLDLIRRVRAADGVGSRLDPALPLVVLSGCGGELDRVRGFERGVDDYVVKPFAYVELRCRIDAVLRRSRARLQSGLLRVGELEIDPVARARDASAGGALTLAAKEFALLRTLASAPTRVFTKEELLREVWGFRVVRLHADAGLPRLPPASEAPRRRATSSSSTSGASGYRLVDGPASERGAVIVALCSWALTLAFVAYCAARAPAARARRARVPRAARPAVRGPARPARPRRRPRADGGDRARTGPRGPRAGRPRRRAARAPGRVARASSSTSARCSSPTRRPGGPSPRAYGATSARRVRTRPTACASRGSPPARRRSRRRPAADRPGLREPRSATRPSTGSGAGPGPRASRAAGSSGSRSPTTGPGSRERDAP